jgi:uncharacterized alkaline shock family protein YloU
MRYKLFDRLLIILILICVLLISVGAIALSLQALPLARVQQLIENLYVYWPNAVMIIAISIVLIVICLRIIYASAGRHQIRQPSSIVVTHGEQGNVNITLDTISSIVERSVSNVEGVKECKNQIAPHVESINILLKVTLDENVPIPEKTAEIQQRLKEEVQHLTGLVVAQIHIIVDHVPVKKNSAQ